MQELSQITEHTTLLRLSTIKEDVQRKLVSNFAACILTSNDLEAILELAFATKSLRQLCENEAKANQELGEEKAEKLKRRLADLRAATYVNDLVAGRPREFNQHFVIYISDKVSIIFSANHNTNPQLKCGKIDWSKVTRIKIFKIGYNYD